MGGRGQRGGGGRGGAGGGREVGRGVGGGGVGWEGLQLPLVLATVRFPRVPPARDLGGLPQQVQQVPG